MKGQFLENVRAAHGNKMRVRKTINKYVLKTREWKNQKGQFISIIYLQESTTRIQWVQLVWKKLWYAQRLHGAISQSKKVAFSRSIFRTVVRTVVHTDKIITKATYHIGFKILRRVEKGPKVCQNTPLCTIAHSPEQMAVIQKIPLTRLLLVVVTNLEHCHQILGSNSLTKRPAFLSFANFADSNWFF